MCGFIFRSAFSKLKTKITKWVRSSSNRLNAIRSSALVRLEGDAAALKARLLRVRQTMTMTKRKREVAAAAFEGGDVCFLGTLSPHFGKTSAQNLHKNRKKVLKKLLGKQQSGAPFFALFSTFVFAFCCCPFVVVALLCVALFCFAFFVFPFFACVFLIFCFAFCVWALVCFFAYFCFCTVVLHLCSTVPHGANGCTPSFCTRLAP